MGFSVFPWKKGSETRRPYVSSIFVLSLECISRMLIVEGNGLYWGFQFQPRCTRLKLCHLAFTDYVILFCKDELASIECLMNVLIEFANTSDLQISREKS